RAPELFNPGGGEVQSTRTDAWSLAMTLHLFLLKRLPRAVKGLETCQEFRVAYAQLSEDSAVEVDRVLLSALPDAVRAVWPSLLSMDPGQRLGVTELYYLLAAEKLIPRQSIPFILSNTPISPPAVRWYTPA